MAYFEIGDDWDGLGAIAPAPPARPASLTASLLPRRQAPIGSIVPTLRARRAVDLRSVSVAEATTIRAARQRAKRRLQAVLQIPERKLLVRARTLRGYGFAGFGETPAGAVDVLRDLSGSLRAAYEEIDGLSLSPQDQSVLGGTLLGQRAGDISAALGIDVAWQDLVSNASGEFARLRQDLRGVASQTVLTSLGFEHISSIFTSQGQTVESLRALSQGAHDLYDRYGSDVMSYIVSDAGAFGEGGLRRLVEGALGEGADKWLTGANLQRLGSAAQAWIGAGGSGSATAYVSAAGATISGVGAGLLAAGAAVVPWGTVVAAVGALVTLLASLLGDEEPPPPPEIKPCEGTSFAAWRHNPEAWTAMAMWLVSRDGKFFDSELYKEAQRRVVTVQQIADEQGWFATIDRYTGEVMVREPGPPGRELPMRRLLDMMDRDAFVLNWSDDGRGVGNPDVFRIFDEMRPAFGLQAHSRWSVTNFLWCVPDPKETLTRFFGAEKFRSRHAHSYTSPFRSDPSGYNSTWQERIGGGISWSWIGEDWFWKLYTRSMVTSMYLAGTVPYGARQISGQRQSDAVVAVSTGVGGSDGFHPMEIRTDLPGIWQPIPYVSGAEMFVEDGEVYPWTEMAARLADQEWRLAHRVPVLSPEIQSMPADAVKRPVAQRCGPLLPDGRRMCMPLIPQRELAPLSVFKRVESSEGLSRGTKIALWTTGGLLVLGGGYLGWRRLRSRQEGR